MEALEEIQQTLQEIYLKNINFFKTHHTSIYNQIVQFEKSLTENYFIDFMDNHFELLDKNNTPTYNCDPFYDAQYRVKNLNKNISGISTIDLKPREISSDLEYDSNKFINEFIELFKSKEINNNINFHKFIFIGTLLGVHINDISDNIDVKSILIVEENIEIFRLSMFLTDYEKVSKKSKLFFAIDCNEIQLYLTIQEFLNFQPQYNYFLKFEIASQKEIELLKNIKNIISSQSKTIYPYSKFIEAYSNGKENFQNIKKLFNTTKTTNHLKDLPTLFLGGGPSLEDNIDFVKNNQDKFIIVTVMASLKRLEKENIIPDIIITVDSDIKLLEFINIDEKFYKNSIIFASGNTHPKIIEKLSISEKLYLFQTNTEIFINYGHFTGATVGDIGVKLLLKLGVTKLYLLGIDASLNQITGTTHDLAHSYVKKEKLEVTTDDNLDFGKQIFKVKGNLKESVYTTGAYKVIIDCFDEISQSLNKSIKIYNLSNHGALLNGTTPVDCNKIKKDIILNKNIDFEQNINNIKMVEINLDKQIIKEYEDLINTYYFYILENHKNIKKKQLDKIKNNQLKIIKTST